MNKDTKELLKLLRKTAKPAGASSVALALAACGGGGGGNTPPVTSWSPRDTIDVIIAEVGGDGHDLKVQDVFESHSDVDNRIEIIGKFITGGEIGSMVGSGADVINTSFSEGESAGNFLHLNIGYTTGVRDAWESGVTFVSAAGNDSLYGVNNPQGSTPLTIDVGAMDYLGYPASYSNWHQSEVDFWALGSSSQGQGTSFAAPRVAAAVANLLENDPELTQAELRTLLELNSRYNTYEVEGNTFVGQTIYMGGKWLTTYEHVIDTRVIVEAAFELFADMNPTQELLDTWIANIDEGKANYSDLKEWLSTTTMLDGFLKGVAEVEVAAAHYHWYEHREATDAEVLLYIDTGEVTFDIPTDGVIA